MMTIQLTDDEHQQFAATGHIVVGGEPAEKLDKWIAQDPSLANWDVHPRYIPPAKWRPASEPCPTCGGKGTIFKPPYVGADPSLCYAQADIHPGDTGPVYCDRLAGHSLVHEGDDIDAPPLHRRVLWKDGFQPSAHRPCPNPDCHRGRQVVTLTAKCRYRESQYSGWCEGGLIWDSLDVLSDPCPKCVGGVVTLGRFTIRLLPVVAEHTPTDRVIVADGKATAFRMTSSNESVFKELALDPLPQPGQFVLAFTAVS